MLCQDLHLNRSAGSSAVFQSAWKTVPSQSEDDDEDDSLEDIVGANITTHEVAGVSEGQCLLIAKRTMCLCRTEIVM